MEEISEQQARRISQFLTTEHFTLQGVRNGAIAEANGRLGHYLSAVGSGIVALAFVANVSELGAVFVGFSVTIFPVLIVLGAATFVRTIQIGIHDARTAQAINRIRHYYVELAPEAAPYLSFPLSDDPDAVRKAMRPFQSPLQGFASAPGPVMLVNSVLCGAFIGILAVGLLPADLILGMIIALVTTVLALVLHAIYASRVWRRETRDNIEVRFPPADDSKSGDI
jgi:hypothetical protein